MGLVTGIYVEQLYNSFLYTDTIRLQCRGIYMHALPLPSYEIHDLPLTEARTNSLLRHQHVIQQQFLEWYETHNFFGLFIVYGSRCQGQGSCFGCSGHGLTMLGFYSHAAHTFCTSALEDMHTLWTCSQASWPGPSLVYKPGTHVYICLLNHFIMQHSQYGPRLDIFSFGHLAVFTLTHVRRIEGG